MALWRVRSKHDGCQLFSRQVCRCVSLVSLIPPKTAKPSAHLQSRAARVAGLGEQHLPNHVVQATHFGADLQLGTSRHLRQV